MKTFTKTKRSKEQKSVICSKCHRTPMMIDSEAVKGICWKCVLLMTEPPKFDTYKPTGRPRGWHFMEEYVDKDGNVFHKGVEQPDLKGTKKPTIIKTTVTNKRKKTKREREREKTIISAEIFDLKKKLEKETRETYKKKIETEINKLQRKIK